MSMSDVKLTDAERQPCEVWTRVMGYFRPLSEFNQGKKAEFFERRYFDERKAVDGNKKTGLSSEA